MELQEALSRISQIRAQIARTETFRGYRCVTVGFTGLAAIAAAGLQAVWVPQPRQQIGAYLALWIGVAALSVAVCGTEMAVRCRRAASPVARQVTLLAVEQFLPSIVAGALLSYAVVLFAPQGVTMLPGLWAVVFSLGVFASCRLLPRPTFWVGVYYLVAGIAVLALARGEAALSPWAMAGTFGVGQLAAAAVLYLKRERSDGRR